ncbi:MAG: hypothetical protein OEV92_04270 [Nitrospinota bacterium]|nr:hypothetical protein [Nitrospinota bacterium]
MADTTIPYIHSINNRHSKKWNSFFAIRLSQIETIQFYDENREPDFAERLLSYQVDLISSMASMPIDGGAEIRYSFHPSDDATKRGHIDVLLRFKTSSSDKLKSIELAKSFFHSIWPSLVSVSSVYIWKPIDTIDEYKNAIFPFEPKYYAEILRREAVLSLERLEPASWPTVGFLSDMQKESGKKSVDEEQSNIYMVFPYIRTFNSLDRMCSSLLMQKRPVVISSALTSTRLSGEEFDFFQDQIEKCEKYIEIPTAERPGTDYLPPYRAQASDLLGTVLHMNFTLRDAPFLLKTQIVSDGPIPYGLIDTVSVSMTEHVCTTDRYSDTLSAKNHTHFAGGYDWILPADKNDIQTCKNNYKFMGFDIWAPSSAPKQAIRLRYLVAPPEANTTFRFPTPVMGEYPGLNTALSRNIPAAIDLPTEGILLGHSIGANGRFEARLTKDDRRRHMYMVGQTGTGKSTLFLNMIMQDIIAGEGVGLIDPHGELVEEVLERIPKERIEDVIYINPEVLDQCVGLNLLEHKDSLEKDFAVNQLCEIFEKLYDMRAAGGPMFEMYMRNAALLVMSDTQTGSTIMEIQKVFTDAEFRKMKLGKCGDPYVKDFWRNMALQAGGEAALSNMAPYIVSKVSRFIYNDAIRGIIAQQNSTINFREVMDKRQILLVDLGKGKLGETNSAFLGMILLGLILKAAMSRTDIKDTAEMSDFYFYVDEFQNLATDSFISILSEARKYRLNAILTNQYLHQIPERVREAVLGNVGTLISLRVGAQDSEILEKEFAPVFSKTDLLNLSTGKGCISLLVDGNVAQPFSITTPPPPEKGRKAVAQALREYALIKNATPRQEVEHSIQQRWGILKQPDNPDKVSH